MHHRPCSFGAWILRTMDYCLVGTPWCTNPELCAKSHNVKLVSVGKVVIRARYCLYRVTIWTLHCAPFPNEISMADVICWGCFTFHSLLLFAQQVYGRVCRRQQFDSEILSQKCFIPTGSKVSVLFGVLTIVKMISWLSGLWQCGAVFGAFNPDVWSSLYLWNFSYASLFRFTRCYNPQYPQPTIWGI